MSFSLSYATLFEVDILHHYWLNEGKLNFEGLGAKKEKILRNYDVSRFFNIQPSLHTQKKLKELDLLFRSTNKGFQVAARKDPTSPSIEPYHEFEKTDKLVFHLYLTDSRFYNYTFLPLPTVKNGEEDDTDNNGQIIVEGLTKQKILHFNNIQNDENHYPSLTKPVKEHDGDKTYKQGEAVTYNQTNHFALVNDVSTDPLSTVDPDLWSNQAWAREASVAFKNEKGDIRPLAYANQEDLTRLAGSAIYLENSNEQKELQVILTNAHSDEDLLSKTLSKAGEENSWLYIQTADFAPGLFTLNIKKGNSSIYDQTLYFSEQSYEKPLAGVVEIYLNPEAFNGNNKYKPKLDKEQGYEIRFKNRQTFWRYFDMNKGTQLGKSEQALPLTERGLINEEINDLGRNLPNPDANMIKPEPDHGFFSDVFIQQNSDNA